MNYETIKQIASENGLRIADMIALAPQNDPFYVGRPAEQEAATWFAGWWRQFGYAAGIHLRRIHYQMVSQSPPVIMPNGKPYENTMECWAFINNASKWARYLDLVDPAAFVDRRNPDAMLNINYEWEDSNLEYVVDEEYQRPELYDLRLPELAPLPSWADYRVTGYEYLQPPVHVEIWCEKTTMNDVLSPLCQANRVNLVTGAGELSITSTLQFMERVATAQRPARIIYISDFDPAGMGMPISVARKIEYWQKQKEEYADLDIRLEALVLTRQQVEQYRLPRIPVKESDRRKGNWARDFGAGAVELDALEALHPGELESIVSQALRRYRDRNWQHRAMELHEDLEQELESIRQAILADPNVSKHVDAITSDYDAIASELDQIRDEIEAAIAPYLPRLNALSNRLAYVASEAAYINQDIIERLDLAEVEMDRYDLPFINFRDCDEPLYNSDLEYLDQLALYKSYRHTGQVNANGAS